MKHTTRLLLTILLVATAATSTPNPSRAGKGDAATNTSATIGGPAQEGAFGALCRIGLSYGWIIPPSGVHGIILSTCILALLYEA